MLRICHTHGVVHVRHVTHKGYLVFVMLMGYPTPAKVPGVLRVRHRGVLRVPHVHGVLHFRHARGVLRFCHSLRVYSGTFMVAENSVSDVIPEYSAASTSHKDRGASVSYHSTSDKILGYV